MEPSKFVYFTRLGPTRVLAVALSLIGWVYNVEFETHIESWLNLNTRHEQG
jgi:hypothetical protein